MNTVINDGFMNPDRFGYASVPFKLDGCMETPREDIPKWKIARTNARSMGKRTFIHTKQCRCGSYERRVYDNKCFPCFKLTKKSPN